MINPLHKYTLTISVILGPFYQHGLTLILAWIGNDIQYTRIVWNKITYSFPNFSGATVEVWEWISDFIPHFTWHVITCQCWNES